MNPAVDRTAIVEYVRLPPEQRITRPWPWAYASHGFHRLPCPERLTGVRRLLYERQRGLCAMCAIREFDLRETYGSVPVYRMGRCEHLDHDHSTGLIRGLLCFRCNVWKEPQADDISEAYRLYPPAEGLDKLAQ